MFPEDSSFTDEVSSEGGHRLNNGLYVDMYSLTTLDAAIQDGTADKRVVFECFLRGMPTPRRDWVWAGLGRWLDFFENFRFGDR